MVNIQKYQWVAIGDTVAECEKAYLSLLKSNGIVSESALPSNTIKGTISKMVPCVVDGNTHYYIKLVGQDEIFDIVLADHIELINYEVGSQIEFEYTNEGEHYIIQNIIS